MIYNDGTTVAAMPHDTDRAIGPLTHRPRKRGGGGGQGNLKGWYVPPPHNPLTFSFNFYVKQENSQVEG